MAKRLIYTLICITILTICPQLQEKAMARIELSELDSQQTKVELSNSTLIISGAAGKTLHIYNLVGMQIMSIKIDSSERRIELSNLKTEVLIVKIGNISKRITLHSR